VATTLLRDLRDHRATILVLEDLHWADEATLDVFRILAGRIRSTPALVLATYRDDELARTHPLRLVLGELGTGDGIIRLAISPLSEDAVATLAAQSGVDPRELHTTTGGNPFYVTEVLASGSAEIPPTVRDAVYARVARLGLEARDLLAAAAVLPPPVELHLLEEVAGPSIDALEECLAAGLLNEHDRRLAFRHELARLAVEDALPPNDRTNLHRAALAAQEAKPAPDLARLAHHAEAAGDGDAVLRFAPAAAERASVVGAHREATAQYERALRFGDALPAAEHAALVDACAVEAHLIGEFRYSISLRRQAADEHARSGDARRQAGSLSALAWLIWITGNAADAEAVLQDAMTALESEPDAPELLGVFAMLSTICLGEYDRDGLLGWVERARELAERLELPTPLYVDMHPAGLEFARGVAASQPLLENAVDRAIQANDDNSVGIGYGLLALGAVRSRQHDLAESYIDAALAYCTERDLTGHEPYYRAWHATLDLQRGRWSEAEATARTVLQPGGVGPGTALTLMTVARLYVRRGQDGGREAVDIALRRAEQSGALWLTAAAAGMAAEAAWLAGEPDAVAALTEDAWEASATTGEPWVAGELAIWRRRAGIRDATPDWIPEPYARELAGDPLGAAALWAELGCPYEAALARADSHDEDELRRALDDLRGLGAEPAAAIVARRLRTRGAKGLPRGPRPATRANPANLTSREAEVLALVAEGLRNGDIAQRLFLSEKTVSHHVSAILRKLDVRTRGEAGAAAVRLGMTRD
jgi:DNA-binding CsgD family transcriptional regulator